MDPHHASGRLEAGNTAIGALAQLSEKVCEVNRIVRLRGSVNGGLVKKLNVTFLGTEFGPDERKMQVDDALRTLNEVAGKVKASGDKFENV